MPVNRNALIRYKTIDKCLSNPYRQWTLEDLIDACSDALYEYEGIDKGVSRRTVQMDIQMMRSDKLGYNAPIEVYDKKYYRYTEADYSIMNMPISDSDIEKLSEITDLLRQFKGFSYFHDLSGIVQRIEDKVNAARHNASPIIDIDRNEGLKGQEHLDPIYKAILKKQVLRISYQSFTARVPGEFIFHPYLLKEFNNRWFVLGAKGKELTVLTLALDRIITLSVDETAVYLANDEFSAAEYYKDVIGVTVANKRKKNVRLFVDRHNSPYVLTKPLHHSQKLIEKHKHGIEIQISVIPNYELERLILGFGEGMTVLEPESLRKRIAMKLNKALRFYKSTE